MKTSHMQKGFTLIELSIAIGILMIVTLMGIKFYKGQMYKSQINNTVNMVFAWAKAMREMRSQEGIEDFSFLTEYVNGSDTSRLEEAFAYYAFPLDDSHNPWGRSSSTNKWHDIKLTLSNDCGGLFSAGDHVCGLLEIETRSKNAAKKCIEEVNGKVGIKDNNGQIIINPTLADIATRDPVTEETFYKEVWGFYDNTNVAKFYVP